MVYKYGFSHKSVPYVIDRSESMNIHIHEDGILLVGKAWEIKARLKQQLKKQVYVSEWIQDVHPLRQKETASDIASKNTGSSLYPRPIVLTFPTDNTRLTASSFDKLEE